MNNKAQSGIGTLIIFIAMLLVAAVAAGVLIQTTGSLQNNALTTGSQAESQISTHMDVIKVTGVDGTDSIIDNVTLLVRLSAGSESIFLNDTTVVLDTTSSTSTFTASDFNINYLSSSVEDDYLKTGDLVELSIVAGPITSGEKLKFTIIPRTGIQTVVDTIVDDQISTYNVRLYP